MIPIDRVCPICRTYQPDATEWSETSMGDMVCRPCYKLYLKQSEEPVVSARYKARSCPNCGKLIRLKRNWRRSEDGLLLCRWCSAPGLEEAEARVDYKGRHFLIRLDPPRACYVFGERAIPKRSEPSSLALFEAQREAMWTMVQANLKLAHAAAQRAAQTGLIRHEDVGEAVSDVCVPALCRAAVEWREGGGAAFSTYAWKTLFRSVARWQRRRTKRHKVVRPIAELDHLAADDDGEESVEAIQEAKAALQSIAGLLSDEDLWVLRQLYVEGRTMEDVGIELGVIRSSIFHRVRRIKRRVLSTLTVEQLERWG